MDLLYHAIMFESVLTPKFCDTVIKYGRSQQDQLARTGTFEDINRKKNISVKDLKKLKKIRNSNIVWMDDAWIYKEIHHYVREANKKGKWNFDWTRSEPCQFTKYNINQHYDWHMDMFKHGHPKSNKHENPNLNGTARKLSVTCSLSDPKDYVGGQLDIHFNHPLKKKKDNIISFDKVKKGSIIVFPSFVWHRVQPVTSGTRYSLVMWNLGGPFK